MSLRTKMVMAFLFVALASVVLVAFAAGLSTTRQFSDYVFRREGEASLTRLQEYYARAGGWEDLDNLSARALMGRGVTGRGMGPAMAVANREGRIVLQGAGFPANQVVPAAVLRHGIPIEVDGVVVGTILAPARPLDLLTPAGVSFLDRARRALILSALGAGALALAGGSVIAGRMTRSLGELEQATRAVASGELGRQVEVRSNDEVGRLANSFNQMSKDLASEESLRRQMTADIAHELRTPLSLILGHAEAMAEGVLPRSDGNLRVVHDEARRLQRIVEDLRTLSLAEAGELSLSIADVSLNQLALKALAAREAFAEAKGIHLRADLTEAGDVSQIDEDRVMQALGNVLDNAFRFTPRGSSIRVRTEAGEGFMRLTVLDGGPGIDQEDLDHLFDRFYRGDDARSRQEGGSGLGLAIARSLIEAHKGKMWAENAPGGGARIVIQLPQSLASASRAGPALA
jgi:signal transduction histidine kinase